MKRLKLLLYGLLPFAAYAQTITVTAPASVPPGQSIDATVTLTGGAGITALQVTIPTGATVKTPIPTAKNKTVQCVTNACIWYGLAGGVYNALPMTDGAVLNLSVPVSATAANGSKINIAVVPIYAVDGAGAKVTVASVPASVTVVKPIDPLDLNSDGVVDVADATAAFTAWSAAPSEANAMQLWALTYRLRIP